MKYYVLKASSEKAICGEYPQIYNIPKSGDNLIIYKDRWNEKYQDFDLNFRFIIGKRARKTDLLSASFLMWPFLLISEKMKHIFKEFLNLEQDAKFFRTTLLRNNVDYEYYIFNMKFAADCLIDFSKSEFAKTTYFKYESEVKICSLDDYNQKVGEFNDDMIYFKKIQLNHNQISQDIYLLKQIRSYIVSENLKSNLEESKISGIEFIPLCDFSEVRF